MAFLRRSRKNVPGGARKISLNARMWRYRDVEWPAQIKCSGQVGAVTVKPTDVLKENWSFGNGGVASYTRWP